MRGVLEGLVDPSADELARAGRGQVVGADATLVPVVNRRHLSLTRHRRHDGNVQVLVDRYGRIIGVSRPVRAVATRCSAARRPG